MNLAVNYVYHGYYLVLTKRGGINPKSSKHFQGNFLLSSNIYSNILKSSNEALISALKSHDCKMIKYSNVAII